MAREHLEEASLSRRGLLVSAFCAAITAASSGCLEAADRNKILLYVRTKYDGSSDAPVFTFDREALEALPQYEFKTSTVWTEGVNTYSGPSLKNVLQLAGAGRGRLTLMAENDYAAIMPRKLVAQNAPIIATRINGKPYTLREKGPLWVVFPYDSDSRFQTVRALSASVWQLIEIRVAK